MDLHRTTNQRRSAHIENAKISTTIPYHTNIYFFFLLPFFVSAPEVPVDRTQVIGWEDLFLQHRDQAVHMGETRGSQISCRGTNAFMTCRKYSSDSYLLPTDVVELCLPERRMMSYSLRVAAIRASLCSVCIVSHSMCAHMLGTSDPRRC